MALHGPYTSCLTSVMASLGPREVPSLPTTPPGHPSSTHSLPVHAGITDPPLLAGPAVYTARCVLLHFLTWGQGGMGGSSEECQNDIIASS